MTEKIAVFAPIPRARASTATMVKPGFLIRTRTEWRTSASSVSIVANTTDECGRFPKNADATKGLRRPFRPGDGSLPPLLAFHNDLSRCVCVAPARHLRPLVFEVFINGKEMLDLAQRVRRNLRRIVDLPVERIALRHAEYLLVLFALVHHLQHADG